MLMIQFIKIFLDNKAKVKILFKIRKSLRICLVIVKKDSINQTKLY